jgi:hypothetical protein
MSARQMIDRAPGYGIPGKQVDGMNVLAVYAAVSDAAEYCRAGNGPVLIDALTYRYLGHSKSDRQLYRTKEEVQAWKQRDAIAGFERYLLGQGIATQEEIDALKAKADAAIEEAIAYGDAGPEPQVAHLTRDVYAEELAVLAQPDQVLPKWIASTFGNATQINPPAGERNISYSEALREAMGQALASDPRVFMLGEDIGVYGGAFGVTKDLVDEFGKDRVRDTPISENAIIGAATGSAVLGMRPIAEMQFQDFITLGMEQLVLQAATGCAQAASHRPMRTSVRVLGRSGVIRIDGW